LGQEKSPKGKERGKVRSKERFCHAKITKKEGSTSKKGKFTGKGAVRA